MQLPNQNKIPVQPLQAPAPQNTEWYKPLMWAPLKMNTDTTKPFSFEWLQIQGQQPVATQPQDNSIITPQWQKIPVPKQWTQDFSDISNLWAQDTEKMIELEKKYDFSAQEKFKNDELLQQKAQQDIDLQTKIEKNIEKVKSWLKAKWYDDTDFARLDQKAQSDYNWSTFWLQLFEDIKNMDQNQIKDKYGTQIDNFNFLTNKINKAKKDIENGTIQWSSDLLANYPELFLDETSISDRVRRTRSKFNERTNTLEWMKREQEKKPIIVEVIDPQTNEKKQIPISASLIIDVRESNKEWAMKWWITEQNYKDALEQKQFFTPTEVNIRKAIAFGGFLSNILGDLVTEWADLLLSDEIEASLLWWAEKIWEGLARWFEQLPDDVQQEMKWVVQWLAKMKKEKPTDYQNILSAIDAGSVFLDLIGGWAGKEWAKKIGKEVVEWTIVKWIDLAVDKIAKATPEEFISRAPMFKEASKQVWEAITPSKIISKLNEVFGETKEWTRKGIAWTIQNITTKATKLQKDDIDFSIKNPELAKNAEKWEITVESIVNKADNMFTKSEQELYEKAGFYNNLKDSVKRFEVKELSNNAINNLNKIWITVDKDGVVNTKWTAIYNFLPNEKEAIEKALWDIKNAVKWETQLTADKVHTLRKNIDAKISAGGLKMQESKAINTIRQSLDTMLKENIAWHKEADIVYSTNKQRMMNAIDWFFKTKKDANWKLSVMRWEDGRVIPTDKFLSFVDGKADNQKMYQQLNKLDQFFPWLSDEIRALKYAKNLQKTYESTPGIYKTITGSLLTWWLTASAVNPVVWVLPLVWWLVWMLFSNPKLLMKMNKMFSKSEREVLEKTVQWLNLSDQDKLLLQTSKIKFDMQQKNIPALPEPKPFIAGETLQAPNPRTPQPLNTPKSVIELWESKEPKQKSFNLPEKRNETPEKAKLRKESPIKTPNTVKKTKEVSNNLFSDEPEKTKKPLAKTQKTNTIDKTLSTNDGAMADDMMKVKQEDIDAVFEYTKSWAWEKVMPTKRQKEISESIKKFPKNKKKVYSWLTLSSDFIYDNLYDWAEFTTKRILSSSTNKYTARSFQEYNPKNLNKIMLEIDWWWYDISEASRYWKNKLDWESEVAFPYWTKFEVEKVSDDYFILREIQ